jgi:cytidylate kinase
MNLIITIGRQYGSGGRYIGQELAKKLNIAFYDQKLLEKVSEQSGLCLELIKDNDEKKDSIFSYMASDDYSSYLTIPQKVAMAQFDTIRKIASEESCVIVGRCSDYILKDHDHVINIFIHAPKKDKLARITSYYHIPESKAEDMMKKMDKKRGGYYSFYTDQKWGHASNYDLTINSSIGIEQSVEVIIALVKQKYPEFFK